MSRCLSLDAIMSRAFSRSYLSRRVLVHDANPGENFGLNRGMDDVLPPAEDADVPAFCQALGLPGLADIHTHFLPPRMLRRGWQYFDAAGPPVGGSWPVRDKRGDQGGGGHPPGMGGG